MKYFNGKKNPPMPESFGKYHVLPLNVSCNQNLSLQKSQWNDISFIKKYHSPKPCSDFNGFNTEQLCKVGVPKKPKSRVIY